MKFSFDLLPNEYKCLPRDHLGILLGALAVMLCLSATATLYYKNTVEMKDFNSQIRQVQTEIDTVYESMKNYQTPTGDIDRLKGIISFINRNLEHPGSSLVDFLFAFEKTVPENIFIQDINPKDFSGVVGNFTVNGEAASIMRVLDFIKSLQSSDRFTNVFLQSNSMFSTDEGALARFVLTFTYKAPK
jgi:Tfp pilus assembly protein PilN